MPEILGFFRQSFFPGAVPRRDRRRGRKIGKARKRRRERVLGLDLQAGVGRVVIEQPQRQRMQHGEKGDAGIVRKRVAQRERMVGRELDHEPVGQAGRVIILVIGRNGLSWPGAVEIRGQGFAGLSSPVTVTTCTRLRIVGCVFAADVAALDEKQAVIAKADKGSGLGLLRVIENRRTVFEVGDGANNQIASRLVLLGAVARFIKRFELVEKGLELLFLILGQRGRNRFQGPEVAVMIPRKIDGGFDPAPAFGLDGLGFGGKLFADQAFEQGNVLQVAAVILVEQIADDDAARGLVGVGADEERAAVAGMHRFLGQHAADGVGSLVPLLLDGGEDLLLTFVVVGEAKRHELIEGDFVVFVSLKQNGARLGETQALFHDMRADAESGGNGFLAFAFVGEGFEGAELIERMQRFALGVLGETVGFDKAFRAHDARDGRVFCELLLFDEKLQRAQAAAAGLHAIGAGFFAGFVQDRADA